MYSLLANDSPKKNSKMEGKLEVLGYLFCNFLEFG